MEGLFPLNFAASRQNKGGEVPRISLRTSGRWTSEFRPDFLLGGGSSKLAMMNGCPFGSIETRGLRERQELGQLSELFRAGEIWSELRMYALLH